MDLGSLSGGFAHASHDAAHAFRSMMEAMARPGTVWPLQGATPPAPLSVAAGTLILTLCDPQTPLHLAGACDTAAVRDWVTFHTGAPLCAPADCAFAVGTWADLGPLSAYLAGTPEYPDRSATLIVQGAGGTPARLTGPGIKDTAMMDLPDIAAMQANARLYPLGLDFYFTDGAQVRALPRSTKVEAL